MNLPSRFELRVIARVIEATQSTSSQGSRLFRAKEVSFNHRKASARADALQQRWMERAETFHTENMKEGVYPCDFEKKGNINFGDSGKNQFRSSLTANAVGFGKTVRS